MNFNRVSPVFIKIFIKNQKNKIEVRILNGKEPKSCCKNMLEMDFQVILCSL